MLGPIEEKIVTLELVIEPISKTRELPIAMAYVGGNCSSSSLVGNPLNNFYLSALYVSSGLAFPILVSPLIVWDEVIGVS